MTTDRFLSPYHQRIALMGNKAKRTDRPARNRAPAKPSSRELWRKAWAKINAERAAGLIE